MDLGGDDQLVPLLRLQPAADDALGFPMVFHVGGDGVHLGGVEEIDPGIEGPVHDCEGRLFVGLVAEGHRAHADVGHKDGAAAEASAPAEETTTTNTGENNHQ